MKTVETAMHGSVSVPIANSCDRVIYDDIFTRGEYRAALDHILLTNVGTYAMNRRRSDLFCVLDLGANLGYFSMYAAYRFMMLGVAAFQIIGVEAVSEIAAECARRIEGSGAEPDGSSIRILSGLVGKDHGYGGVEISASHPASRLVSGAREMAPDTKAVRLVGFLNLRTLNLGNRIDLIKCDIEGAEQLFVETYPDLLERTDALVIEFHDELCDTAAARRAIEKAGLTLQSAKHRKLRSDREMYKRPNRSTELFTR